MTRADPWEGDHYARDWKDALHMVRTYAGLEDSPSEASMQDTVASDGGVVLLNSQIKHNLQVEIRRLKEIYAALPFADPSKPGLKDKRNSLRDELPSVSKAGQIANRSDSSITPP